MTMGALISDWHRHELGTPYGLDFLRGLTWDDLAP